MTRFRPWLQLIRVAALPTALADVWLGAAVAGFLLTWQAALVSLASLCLYAAGMVLNDVADVDTDRRDNPARPLPARTIAPCAARIAGFALLATGTAVAFAVRVETGLVAAFVALLVLLYDFATKSTPFGPVNMGLCRAANVAIGLSLAPAMLDRPLIETGAALPVFLYVMLVSILARFEDRRPELRPVVRFALIGILPLQAGVAAVHGRFVAAGCILALLLPILLLRRLSHIT
jgi:4-hydroxybenzoate polyprenyltransferase